MFEVLPSGLLVRNNGSDHVIVIDSVKAEPTGEVMKPNLYKLNAQNGIGLISLVGYTFALLFIVVALNYRINQIDMTANGDLAFRIMMLIYFAIVTYKLVPIIAQQQFVIDVLEKDKGPHEDKIEYIMLFFAMVFGGLLTAAPIVGTTAAPDRRGSGGEYDSLTQPGEYWFAFLASYVIFVFLSASYWYLRHRRLAN
jgi:hypothetical protein